MSRKVLIVEDDKNIADLLRIYLEKDEMECQIAPEVFDQLRREIAPEDAP